MALTSKQQQAAALLAEDCRTDEAIAERVRVSRRTLASWKTDRAFQERIEEISRQIGKAALQRSIARKTHRISVLADKHSALLTVMEQRAVAPEMAAVPGGKTGLVVRKAVVSAGKIVGYEFSVDTASLRELRAIQEQVARELGQHVEKHEMKVLSLKDMTDEQLDAFIAEAKEDVT